MYDLIRQTIKLLARKLKKMSQLVHLFPIISDDERLVSYCALCPQWVEIKKQFREQQELRFVKVQK